MGVGARSRGKARRPNYRAVKIHRSYTVEQAAATIGFAKGTVLRWVSSGALPALTDQRPYLILGADLKSYLLASRPKKQKTLPHQFYCMKCKGLRSPALGMVDFVPMTPTSGNLGALCEVCSTAMHKATSTAALEVLKPFLQVIVQQVPEHLVDTSNPSSDDHFGQEPRSDA
jgi:excisionase family DNA binding protein